MGEEYSKPKPKVGGEVLPTAGGQEQQPIGPGEDWREVSRADVQGLIYSVYVGGDGKYYVRRALDEPKEDEEKMSQAFQEITALVAQQERILRSGKESVKATPEQQEQLRERIVERVRKESKARESQESGETQETSKRVNFILSDDVYDDVARLAKKKSTTVAEVLRDAIALELWLQKELDKGNTILVGQDDRFKEVIFPR